MYKRIVTGHILDSLQDTPVVLLNGARQVGKSTLVKQLAETEHPAQYITFDEIGALGAARNDPVGFLQALQGPVVIDEVQRAPELYLPLKVEVDQDRTPGRFLLTGSTDLRQPLVQPKPHQPVSLAEALVGRMEVHTLWPLSRHEIEGHGGLVRQLFSDDVPTYAGRIESQDDIVEIIMEGGFPEAVGRKDHRRRQWFQNYIKNIIEREIRNLSNIENMTVLRNLLALLATRAMSLENVAELSRSSKIKDATLRRYISLLERTFLIQYISPWSGNQSKRLVKSKKVMFTDTGLLANLCQITPQRIAAEPTLMGPLLENFVGMELVKQCGELDDSINIYHYRTSRGMEVDFVLEDGEGRCIGVEVKSRANTKPADFKGLRYLADELGQKFHFGVVFYTGQSAVPTGKKLWSLPVDSLWRGLQ